MNTCSVTKPEASENSNKNLRKDQKNYFTKKQQLLKKNLKNKKRWMILLIVDG